jgi:hypothetical protein
MGLVPLRFTRTRHVRARPVHKIGNVHKAADGPGVVEIVNA